MKQVLKMLFVVLITAIAASHSFAQNKATIQTEQKPDIQFNELVVQFSEIAEIADLKTMIGVQKLADAQGEAAQMLSVLDQLINYNAGKLYKEGAINWSLPKEAVVVLYNPRLDAQTVKTQFLQVVSQSYQTVKQLHEQGKTPTQIREYLLNAATK